MNAPQSEPPVLATRDKEVLRLVLNRPGARNALGEELMRVLHQALEWAAQDKLLRVIVLAAEGKAFSSGHDLKEMTAHRSGADRGSEAFTKVFAQCSRLMQAIVRHP